MDSGQYSWNAGIFIFQAKTLIENLKITDSELYREIHELNESNIGEKYPNIKDISIDYAVMEKAKSMRVVKGDFGWSDLGSLEAFFDFFSSRDIKPDQLKADFVWSELPGLHIASEGQINVNANGYLISLPYGKGQEVKKIQAEFKNV